MNERIFPIKEVEEILNSVLQRKLDNYWFSSTEFKFDIEGLATNTTMEQIKFFLRLVDEKNPTGKGYAFAFYEKESGNLKHLLVFRIISSPSDPTDRVYFGLRYSPFESQLVRIDSWPIRWSSTKARISPERRAAGLPTNLPGRVVRIFAEEMGIGQNFGS